MKTPTNPRPPLPYGSELQILTMSEEQAVLPMRVVKRMHGPYLNFAQTFEQFFSENHELNPDTAKALDEAEGIEAANMPRHPLFNTDELPFELLQRAISQAPGIVLQHRPMVQRALARLYAVARFGRGLDAKRARLELKQLIPKESNSKGGDSGRPAHPFTKHSVAILDAFNELLDRIKKESESLMGGEENVRYEKLAKMFNERPEVISDALDALEKKKGRFLVERLIDPKGPGIDKETARKHVGKYLKATLG